MAEDWLWQRHTSKPVEGELVSKLPDTPKRPPFDVTSFERACLRAREEIETLMDEGYLPDAGTAYTSRLDVLKGFFKSYAVGALREEDVITRVTETARKLQDTYHGALLALEYAKLGLLEMHRPDVAEHFAEQADRLLTRSRVVEGEVLPHLTEVRDAGAI